MTSDEFQQKTLREDIQRILKSPDEIERWLAAMDFLISVHPKQRLCAVDLLTETAAQAEAALIGPRLLEAADAMRAGKPSAVKPLPPAREPSKREQVPIPEFNLIGIEVSPDKFERVMRERNARGNPDTGRHLLNGDQLSYWTVRDGRIAGWQVYEDRGRGEFTFQSFVAEPWADKSGMPRPEKSARPDSALRAQGLSEPQP